MRRGIAHALLRPRGRRRGRRSGVALLVVISTLMVLTVLVTELTYGTQVRYMVGTHRRDRVQAYWLARSGVNIYRLILTANKQLEGNSMLSQAADQAGINLGDALWQMVPVLNTGLIRMLLGSGGSASDVEEEDMEAFKTTGRVSEEIAEESKEAGLFSDRNFLDFDGDFSAEVHDHEGRVNVNFFATESQTVTTIQDSPVAQMLYSIMSGEENDQWFHEQNIDRWEIIGNLKDWVDTDTYRSGGPGGLEDSLYNRGDSPFLCKNAPFDTLDEIRLVEGWQDDVYERFGDKLTVYGKSKKINVNTADDVVLYGLIRMCTTPQPTVAELELCFQQPGMLMDRSSWTKASELGTSLETYCGIAIDKTCLKEVASTSSQTFTVTSTGLVGTSEVTVTTVIDFNSNTAGEMVYWRVD